jgi:hypothetical protein
MAEAMAITVTAMTAMGTIPPTRATRTMAMGPMLMAQPAAAMAEATATAAATEIAAAVRTKAA